MTYSGIHITKDTGLSLPASERVEILIAGPFDDPEEGFGLQQALLEEVAAQNAAHGPDVDLIALRRGDQA